jgi:surface antigen
LFRRGVHLAIGALVAGVVAFAPISSAMADRYWQCAPFARLLSGIQIFGDAHTWWRQATGRYETGVAPRAGSVLCQVLTDRVIQITHANWSRIGGARGQVERDVTVIDVSPAGDWSRVKVWYDPVRDVGSSTYPTYGFIYQDAQAVRLAASQFNVAQNAALTVAQSAANQVASTVMPGATPLSILGQAADAGDRIAALIQAVTAPPPR